ncbi:MAG: hypothetical protein ABID04_01665 [Patescibacteria group bacterium]
MDEVGAKKGEGWILGDKGVFVRSVVGDGSLVLPDSPEIVSVLTGDLPPGVGFVDQRLLESLREKYALVEKGGLTQALKTDKVISPDGKGVQNYGKIADLETPLSSRAGNAYLSGDFNTAVSLQLKEEEFSGNQLVITLFDRTLQYLTELNGLINNPNVLVVSRDQPENEGDILTLIKCLAEGNLDEVQEQSLPAGLQQLHREMFLLLQNSSMETIEELSTIVFKLVSSQREYSAAGSKSFLTVLDFVFAYKGKSERRLLLPSSLAIGSALVDSLRRQEKLRSPENLKLFLSLADWLDFNTSDAGDLLCFFLGGGISMRHPTIVGLALQVETESSNSNWSKEQAIRRARFTDAFDRARDLGYQEIFIKNDSLEAKQEFKRDFDELRTADSAGDFLDRYFPKMTVSQRASFQTAFRDSRADLSNRLLTWFGRADGLVNEIVFAFPPDNSGRVGFEAECFMSFSAEIRFRAIPLPDGFYFTFPAKKEVNGSFPIEIKPGLPFINGEDALKRALEFSLWCRRSRKFFGHGGSLHIHFDRKDFPSFETRLRDEGIFLPVMKPNDLGTWETREWLPPYWETSCLLNRLLLGQMLLDEPDEARRNLFGLVTETPTSDLLFNSGRFSSLRKYIEDAPGSYLVRAALRSSNAELAKMVFEIPQVRKYIEDAPGSDLVRAALESSNASWSVIEILKSVPKNDLVFLVWLSSRNRQLVEDIFFS